MLKFDEKHFGLWTSDFSSATDIVAFCTSHTKFVGYAAGALSGAVLFMIAEPWVMCAFKHTVIKGFDAVVPQVGKQAWFLIAMHFLEISCAALVQNQ